MNIGDYTDQLLQKMQKKTQDLWLTHHLTDRWHLGTVPPSLRLGDNKDGTCYIWCCPMKPGDVVYGAADLLSTLFSLPAATKDGVTFRMCAEKVNEDTIVIRMVK